MILKKIFSYSLILFLMVGINSGVLAEKGKKNVNTKKADVKKVSRGEHKIVQNWENLNNRIQKKKNRIKKKFQ